jgi:hypothetical protein
MSSDKAVRHADTADVDELAAPGTECVVVSLDQTRSGTMLRRLRRTRFPPPPMTHPWGSLHAYEELLILPRPLALLDVPGADWVAGLGDRVGLLRRLAPVIVLVPDGTDAVGLLDAGAANVLTRDLPARELAVRLAADQRWLAKSAAQDSGRRRLTRNRTLPQHGTQRLLLRLLLNGGPRPWCCHDLSVLLGAAERPLSRRALDARVLRLDSYLGSMELSLHRTVTWGRTTYTLR